MMKFPFFQVDAFTRQPFKGNPAAVCLMPCGLEDDLYLSIAKEMNLSETAFNHIGVGAPRVSFETLSGTLFAERSAHGIRMDFPRNDPAEVEIIEPVLEALGIEDCADFQYSDTNQKLLVRLENRDMVVGLRPDFSALMGVTNTLGWRGVIVTSEASGPHDFVSRYFAPWVGINEDPVTGSAHTVLGPYWGRILGKDEMRAYQASERGGELLLELTGQRVYITGEAVTVVRGHLEY
jgi:PhzF family phenazine biosynthesis protein